MTLTRKYRHFDEIFITVPEDVKITDENFIKIATSLFPCHHHESQPAHTNSGLSCLSPKYIPHLNRSAGTTLSRHLFEFICMPPPPPPRQTQAKQIEEKKEKLKKYNNTKIRNMYHVSCFVSCYLGYGWGCKNTKYSLWAHSMSNMISLDRSLYIQHGIALCLINSCGTVSPIDVSIALYAVSSFVMYNLQRVHYLSVTPVSVFTGQSHKSHNASDKYPTMRHFVI